MPTSETQKPWIQMDFEGIVALCVSVTTLSGNPKTTFDAGIMQNINPLDNEIPFHSYSIEIRKWVNGRQVSEDGFPVRYSQMDGAPAPRFLYLELEPESLPAPHIKLLARGGTNDSEDFKWVVDVEKMRRDNKPVNIVSQALRTLLRVNNVGDALFFAREINKVDIPVIKEGNPAPPHAVLPGAAESVGVKLHLPPNGARLFKSDSEAGPRELVCTFISGVNVTYEFNFRNNCMVLECSEAPAIDFYNNLIGYPVGGGDRIIFGKREDPQIESLTGHIPCDVVNFGISDNLPPPA